MFPINSQKIGGTKTAARLYQRTQLNFLKMKTLSPLLLLYLFFLFSISRTPATEVALMPNILIAIADDQSYPHTEIYGFAEIQTPAFNYIAQNGVLFHNAFVAAPQCSPSRAAMLTGKNIWELEEAEPMLVIFQKI